MLNYRLLSFVVLSIFKPTIDKLTSLIEKAEMDLQGLGPFSFSDYEVKQERKSLDGENVFWHYGKRINELKDLKSIGTADWYAYSLNSFKKYLVHLNDRTDRLAFERITPIWLLHVFKGIYGNFSSSGKI